MNKSLPYLFCLLALSGCQLLPQPAESPATETSAPAEAATPATPPVVRNFDRGALYDLLLAEMAGQRQQPGQALQGYRRQLERTQSPAVAERALRIAEYMNDQSLALESALLWAQLAPDDASAQRAAALELTKNNRYQQALDYTSRAISLDPDSEGHFDFIAFTAAHADPAMRNALVQRLVQLDSQHPDRSELKLAQAILLQEDAPGQALQLLHKLPASDRQSSVALALQARLYLQLDQPERSLELQQQLLERQPDNQNVRFSYARQLINYNRLEEARNEFVTLLQNEPDNDDFRLALAYLYMDLEAWQEALLYFQELIERDSYTDTALYNQGRCLEALDQPQLAINAYQGITEGQYFLAAQQQLGHLWLQLDSPQHFARQLARARQLAPDEHASLLQIEIDVLNRNQHSELAWQRAQYALAQFPDHPGLLYSRAMLAEKRNDLTQLETDLRHILTLDPAHAVAMNALGYTLADRTGRYQEALSLIQRAHQLQPDDPATLDSLGWVYYRLDQPAEALSWLEKAHAVYPDPEVSAHLGEVLWALGEKRKARKVWRDALKEDPEHDILRETMQRLDTRKGWLK
ncbi:MAG: tetratricopeptide repeat protein [Gammaproteobacteria bacterium]|nr:tetratricopeptide repeat protein [Gammaproteobacteria bacterium]